MHFRLAVAPAQPAKGLELQESLFSSKHAAHKGLHTPLQPAALMPEVAGRICLPEERPDRLDHLEERLLSAHPSLPYRRMPATGSSASPRLRTTRVGNSMSRFGSTVNVPMTPS